MNALQIRMAVLKSVLILTDHFSVAVTVDTVSPMMEDLVWMLINAYLAHTAANSAALTPLEELCVAVIQDSSLILTNEHAVVE